MGSHIYNQDASSSEAHNIFWMSLGCLLLGFIFLIPAIVSIYCLRLFLGPILGLP